MLYYSLKLNLALRNIIDRYPKNIIKRKALKEAVFHLLDNTAYIYLFIYVQGLSTLLMNQKLIPNYHKDFKLSIHSNE